MKVNGITNGADRERNRWATVVARTVPVPVTGADFVQVRAETFQQLIVTGRQEFAEFLGAEVQAQMSREVKSISGCADGGPMRELAGKSQVWSRREDFARVCSVAAAASATALMPCQTFQSVDQGKARVALVLLADPSLSGGSAPAPSPAAALSTAEDWFKSLPDDVLGLTLGVRPRFFGGTSWTLIGFGQAVATEDVHDDDAADLARRDALEQLRAWKRGRIASRTVTRAIAQSTKASDATAGYKTYRDLESSTRQEIDDTFGGEQRIGLRFFVDPSSHHRVCVAACAIDLGEESPLPEGGIANVQAGCPEVPANMRESVRQVKGHGHGDSRRSALKMALMDAIAQDGVKVEGSSLLRKQYEMAFARTGEELDRHVKSITQNSSTTSTFSSGFILSYAIVDERMTPPSVEVSVCANLVRFDPKNPRFGMPPTVAVLPISVGVANVGGATVPPDQFARTAEGILESALLDSGRFQVLGERDLPALQAVRYEIAERAREGRVDELELIKLGKELTADFVLIGSISSVSSSVPSRDRPGRIEAADAASTALDFRLLDVAQGAIACRGNQPIRMSGRDLLLVRAKQGLQHPSEVSLTPADLVVSRASRAAAAELLHCVNRIMPEKRAEAGPQPDPNPQANGELAAGNNTDPIEMGVRVVRVDVQEVTLNAASPSVRVGARFHVINLVQVRLPGRNVVHDRDRVATVEVTSVHGGLAKARVIEGDIDLVNESSILEPAA